MKKIVEVITQPLSMEDELEVELEIRRILALEDINELRALSALLMKQNACQSHVIMQSLTKSSLSFLSFILDGWSLRLDINNLY